MAELPSPLSRSPSPAPADPTPLPVSAVPGARAASFVKLYSQAIQHVKEKCNYENFAACFPTPAEHVPEALAQLHKEFLDRLWQRCQAEFDLIMQERNVVPALNDLDRLVEEARQRRRIADEQSQQGGPVMAPLPPQSISASTLVYAQLGPKMRAEEQRLKAELERLRDENHELSNTITQQRQQVASILQPLQAIVGDIDGSLGCVTHDELVGLTKEAVADDTVMVAAG